MTYETTSQTQLLRHSTSQQVIRLDRCPDTGLLSLMGEEFSLTEFAGWGWEPISHSPYLGIPEHERQRLAALTVDYRQRRSTRA